MKHTRSIVTFLIIAVCAIFLESFSAAQQFLTGTVYRVGNNPGQIIAADLNNDGKLDLAVCDQNQGVALLLGNGDGTFQPATHFRLSSCTAIAAADFNSDGFMDLAVVQYLGSVDKHSVVIIFLGSANGTFTEFTHYSGGNGAVSIAVGDFNGDKHPDLAIAFSFQNLPQAGYVGVLLGNGNGTFEPFEEIGIPRGHPWSVAAGDVNGDGHVDLVVSNDNNTETSPATLFVFVNNGDGTFTRTADHEAGYEALDVVIADVNHDNNPDLVVASASDQVIGVFLGNGNGTFQNPITYSTLSTGTAPDAVVVADFNLDGNPDIIYLPQIGNPGLMYGNGNGTFQSPVAVSTIGAGGSSLAVGDFNQDGAPDFAVSLADKSSAVVFINAQ
jgi:hypothetical protein